ncbi:MAG: exodeoxyribonuclease VII large subunit, partial [Lysobacter sp.]|nr:exodeoxyribonuclease VII large subunit [Lysobacter sp.]
LRAAHPQRRLARLRQRLDALAPRPQAIMVRRLRADTLRLRGLVRSLHAVSPLATVARGYAILQRDDGHVVRRMGDVQPGERVHARLQDGVLPLRVEPPDEA